MAKTEDQLKQKTISSLFWKLFEQGGNALVQLIVQIILARLLMPEQFGALAIMLVFVNVGNVIVQSGLNTALVQSETLQESDCSTVFWMSFTISIVLFGVIFFSAPYIAAFYSLDFIICPLRILALILVINSINSVFVAIIQRALEFKKLFYSSTIAVIVSGLVGIVLAFSGGGIWALVVQQLLYQLTSCFILFFLVKWRPKFVFKKQRAKVLFSFGWRLLVSGILDQGYQSIADLIIGRQFSASALGLVSQGKRYPMALGVLINNSIQPVMLSVVSRVQSDLSSVKGIVRRGLKTSTFLVVPCMTAFAVVAEPIVRLLLGEQWLGVVPFLQMYCFIYALLPIHTTNLQALNGMGRSDLFLKLEVIKKSYGIIFIFVGAFVFENIYVLVGCYILSGIISTFVNAWPNKRIIKYGYLEQIKDICPAFLLSGVAAFAASPVVLLSLPDYLTIICQIIVMAAIYIGLAKLFRVEELSYLFVTLKEFLKK